MMNNNDNKDIKFTGDPVVFDGVEGKRDPKTGKGRFDLIPEEVFGPLFDRVHTLETTEPYDINFAPDSILEDIANEKWLDVIIKMTILSYGSTTSVLEAFGQTTNPSTFFTGCWNMFLDLAIHFQKGAEHYGERNCQKGIPLWSFKDSAMRHAAQAFAGKTDEPHIISVIWNCWMAEWTVVHERQEVGLNLVGMKLRTAEEIAAAKSATPISELKVMKLQSALKEAREAGYIVAKPESVEDAIKTAGIILITYRKELKKKMFMHIKGSPEYEAFNRDQQKLKQLINTMKNITTDIPCVIAGRPISHEEAKTWVENLKKFAEEHDTPVVTAIQHSYTREEVEAIKKETIEDYLTKRDNVTEIVQKIVKKFGAPCIIKALDEFNELMYNGDAFIHEFVKFMDTPEGKERARWFYGPDDLFKDLIDRVENTRGAGQDYHDYVPLLLQLNSAYTEFLNNAES